MASSDIEGEVLYATRVEYAQTATDVLARRTRLSFLNASAALDALPRVIEIMAGELGWNEGRKKKEWMDARKFLVSMGLPEIGRLPGDLDYGKSAKKLGARTVGDLVSRAHFTLQELARLKDVYSQRVGGGVEDVTKGVTTSELLALVKDDMGYARSETSVRDVLSALQAVGVDVRNTEEKTYTFDEFVDVSSFLSISRWLVVQTWIAQVAATFKEAVGRKITVDLARQAQGMTVPVEKSGGGV